MMGGGGGGVGKIQKKIRTIQNARTSRRMPIVLGTFTYCTAKVIDL